MQYNISCTWPCKELFVFLTRSLRPLGLPLDNCRPSTSASTVSPPASPSMPRCCCKPPSDQPNNNHRLTGADQQTRGTVSAFCDTPAIFPFERDVGMETIDSFLSWRSSRAGLIMDDKTGHSDSPYRVSRHSFAPIPISNQPSPLPRCGSLGLSVSTVAHPGHPRAAVIEAVVRSPASSTPSRPDALPWAS